MIRNRILKWCSAVSVRLKALDNCPCNLSGRASPSRTNVCSLPLVPECKESHTAVTANCIRCRLPISFTGLRATTEETLSHFLAIRKYTNLPESTVYTGPQSPAAVKRITLSTVRRKYMKGELLSMVTAYDYPSAVHVDTAGIDLLLVGDSVGMVVHGHDTTLPVTVEDMLLHCKAVARGARRPFLIADMPFGSYESSPRQAVETAVRFLKDGNMDAVKLEGGDRRRTEAVEAVVGAGIAVMGHTGLMPQSVSVLGGFGPQGRTAGAAMSVIRDAIRLWKAGCFAVVLECVPAVIAAAISKAIEIPTIGIGAGPHCSGQVLVYHDLLGMMQHPHYVKVTPKFCKQYTQIGAEIVRGLEAYNQDVKNGEFPSQQYSPYSFPDAEVDLLKMELQKAHLTSALDGLEEFADQDKDI